ncbi:EthD domain-containing protein [Novosphingobium colocasiae]
MPELFTGEAAEPEHDVVTELWFADRAAYDAAMANLSRPEVVAEIVEDEETIFDRSKHRVFMVDECDSVIT